MICCILLTSLLSGCGKYDKVTAALNAITIQNTLPIVEEDASYEYLEEIDELVYEQQINACMMYADTYNKTYYQQFKDGSLKADKLVQICGDKRREINTDIEIAFDINIYRMLQDVTDCGNMDAYVVKTHKDVVDFYDVYSEYQNGDTPQDTLIDILLEYADRSNILAFKFLDYNDTRVFKAAVSKIEDNANTDEDFRVKINENNLIISALNTVYGGVPDEYSEKISEFNTELAKRYIHSIENITDAERDKLLNQLSSSASPSPTPILRPTISPLPTSVPTLKPLATPIPATPKPTAVPTPKPTAIPTPKPTVAPTSIPRTESPSVPQTTSVPSNEHYEPIFGVDTKNDNESKSDTSTSDTSDNGDIEFKAY